MSWDLEIRDEQGNIPEVKSVYIGGIRATEPLTGLPIVRPCVRPCAVNVTYNYGDLLREAGMPDALKSLRGRKIDPVLVTELVLAEGNLGRMCVGREPSGDYWNGKDPHNVLKLVHWLREASEELGARGGKFTVEVW